MKISVITVCYNSEKTIERTIQSVISQTYEDIEYIIIDGKSTDQTLSIVEKFRPHITQLISEADDGIYEAMNKGLQIATGEIICFLNSDDIYNSNNVLEKVINQFKTHNIDALFGNVSYFSKNNVSRITRIYRIKEITLTDFKYGLMPAHPASFLKKKLIKNNGLFDTNFKIAGDFDYMLRLFKNNKFKSKFCKNIYVKMQNDGTSNKNLKSKFIINKEILNSCLKNNLDTNILKILIRYLIKIREIII